MRINSCGFLSDANFQNILDSALQGYQLWNAFELEWKFQISQLPRGLFLLFQLCNFDLQLLKLSSLDFWFCFTSVNFSEGRQFTYIEYNTMYRNVLKKKRAAAKLSYLIIVSRIFFRLMTFAFFVGNCISVMINDGQVIEC